MDNETMAGQRKLPFCRPPGRWIMKQWPASVNSRFAEVTENHSCQVRVSKMRESELQVLQI